VRSIVFVLWLLAAPAVFAQEDRSARQVLDECIESVADDVIGMPALEEKCPGLEQALIDLGLDPFISDEQWDRLGVYGLITLRTVADRYSESPPDRTVQAESLDSILDELKQPEQVEQPLTWLERFKRWLRNLMGQQESAAESWLSRWFEEHTLSETARNVLFYGSLTMVLLLAAAVIINEVRVARKGRRKRDRTGAFGGTGVTGDAPAARSLDLDAAARSERPSILLQMLVATLVKTGRLQAERSLTHRELIGRAKFDDSSQRESFGRVAQLAERIVYGGDEAPAELDEVVQAGRALHSQLSGVIA
jgi:hypothetical protein